MIIGCKVTYCKTLYDTYILFEKIEEIYHEKEVENHGPFNEFVTKLY